MRKGESAYELRFLPRFEEDVRGGYDENRERGADGEGANARNGVVDWLYQFVHKIIE
jgi:hypothetical protein